MNLKKRNHPLKNGFFVMFPYVFLLSGFGLEFGDGGVALTDFFAGFLALQICFFLPLHVSDSAHGWLISEIWHYLSPFYYIEPLQILQDCLHGFFSYVYKKECRKTDTLFQIHCLQYLNLEK